LRVSSSRVITAARWVRIYQFIHKIFPLN